MIKDGKGKGRSYAGAMKAKKNRDLARGFGAGRDGMLRPGTYEVSISELKKRTKCNKCGQLGHWARECPSKTKKPLGSSSSESGRSNSTKSKEVNYLAQDVVPESEFFFLTSEPIEEGNEGEGVADFYDDRRYAGHSDDCLWLSRDYMERPQPHPCFHVDTCFDLACATIDTGCQRMAIGLNTLSSITQTQPPELPVTYHDELHQFRSVHQVSCTHRLACIPCSLGPKGCILRPALFEESSSADAPFLLSLPFLLHCRATLILDEQQGLSLMSRKFGFKVRCFLGPTGALRIPIQQFTGEMIQALSQQVSSDSREYELLRTEHCDSNVSGDPRTLASTGRSQVREPTPFPGAVSRDISLSNDGRPFEARQNRIYVTTQGDPSMESHGSTSNVDHHPSNRPSGDYVPEHGGASRSVGSTDDRVWRATGCPAVGCGGDSSRTTPSRAISARVQGADLITNSIQLVTSDIHTSTGTTSSATYASHSQDQSTKFNAGNSGSLLGFDVGSSSGNQSPEGFPSVLLPQECAAVRVQDREEPQSTLLEMSEPSESSVLVLPMVGSGDDSSRPSTGGNSGVDSGVDAEAAAGSLPTHSNHEERIECLLSSHSMPGLRHPAGEGKHRIPTTESRIRAEVRGSGKQQGSEDPSDAEHGEGVRGVLGVAQSANGRGDEHRSSCRGSCSIISQAQAESKQPVLVDEVRAGLRRHIYGCLKRSEQCWLDIFQLLCSSSEEEQSKHLETTCAVIRKTLQLQQPHMKHLTEVYALQPKQLKTIAEICNPKRFGKHADYFGLRAGQAFDLELGWNLLDRKQQSYVRSYILTEKPGLVVLSPPCTKFSMLQNLSYPKWCGDPIKFRKHLTELRQAKELLRFCVEICELCRQIGITFLFEHPWSASSWSERCLQQLIQHDDVFSG